MSIERDDLGPTPDGGRLERFVLDNERGARATISSWGATWCSMRVPDREGQPDEVLLGFADLRDWLGPHAYFGSTLGRFANRISGARFRLDGREYPLSANEPPNHIHGGEQGFDRRSWSARAEASGVVLERRSPAGEEGYPGNLDVEVRYSLDPACALRIDYRASSDAPTVVSLTNHAYFDLGSRGAGSVLEHELEIAADAYAPTGPDRLPTGEQAPVRGTALDFSAPRRIGERIAEVAPGYDHTFVLRERALSAFAARARSPESGRVLEVATTQPALQLYTGNHFDGALQRADGRAIGAHAGFCLEAQGFPDAPNQPEFPSAVLRPGELYRHTTVYQFSTDAG